MKSTKCDGEAEAARSLPEAASFASDAPSPHTPRSIVLPHNELFTNLKNAKRFAIDIATDPAAAAALCSNIRYQEVDGMRLHFVKFETKYIEQCLEFIKGELLLSGSDASRVIKATGGGSFKYLQLIQQKLNMRVDKLDEMECLIGGCNFLLRNIPDEAFTYSRQENQGKYRFHTFDPLAVFPYLLVNIGSGVSVIKVESDDVYERVGGSSMGGGSFWGLGSLLTGARDFDDLLALAEQGDHRNVDLLVCDIYGGAYQKLGLPGDLIASSFGKTVRHRLDENYRREAFSDADKARSLLLTLSNSLGQIAVLYAQLHEMKRIYFGGYFIRNHPITMHTISYAINYWSKGQIQALFLRHEGYLGAVGAFMKGAEDENNKLSPQLSWSERHVACSPFGLPAAFQHQMIELLEMESADKSLTRFPLLAEPADSYVPDTVDLTTDDDARNYWLTCLEGNADKTADKAASSQGNTEDARDRAANFKHRYRQHLRFLRQRPFLLDLSEQLLSEFYFDDAYLDVRLDLPNSELEVCSLLQQKRAENAAALAVLPKLLKQLDALDWKERQLALARGLLAGNVFDWGAKQVVALLESSDGLSFAAATDKLQGRPWLCDDYDSWLNRLQNGESHRCACIFVDNSGADIVLGVIPFVRELLRRGTKVILCANSRAALNDVTIVELVALMRESIVASNCDEIAEALERGRLLFAENGQASPCLDLSRVDGSLCEMVDREGVDLVVIEGMGRAVHTNFEARFKCDTLKAAVIKNLWLANRLGGDLFSVIFKFQQPTTKVTKQVQNNCSPP